MFREAVGCLGDVDSQPEERADKASHKEGGRGTIYPQRNTDQVENVIRRIVLANRYGRIRT